MTPLQELQSMITGTLAAYKDSPPKVRSDALKAIQWRLRGPCGEFAGLSATLVCSFVPERAAMMFDGRDNETGKLWMYERTLGPLTVEILPQIVSAQRGGL